MKFKSLIFIVLAASMTCTDIYAENNRPIDIALWENGPLEKNDDEGKTYDENVRIYRPSIKVFLPEGKNTGRAVIMCPGGGYALLAYDHEGYAMPTTSNIKASPSLSSNTACRTEITKSPCPMFARPCGS